MNLKHFLVCVGAGLLLLAGLGSCSDDKTYAELLIEEAHYVNAFLADQRVVNYVPEDTVFEIGPNAPYYRLDEDGTMYMQVLNAGTKGNMAKSDELLYFRYTRWALEYYQDGELPASAGNNQSLNPAWFRFQNLSLASSAQWGTGIQYPLQLLPVDCEVNIVIKAAYGPTKELSEVKPFLYRLTYQRPLI
ncbi:MAG: DUF4827 domain-containing protein [Muribaculaceae bacterium]|nr:DUF4827 domain-containing protein [Muribaculaceae bacterium]